MNGRLLLFPRLTLFQQQHDPQLHIRDVAEPARLAPMRMMSTAVPVDSDRVGTTGDEAASRGSGCGDVGHVVG